MEYPKPTRAVNSLKKMKSEEKHNEIVQQLRNLMWWQPTGRGGKVELLRCGRSTATRLIRDVDSFSLSTSSCWYLPASSSKFGSNRSHLSPIRCSPGSQIRLQSKTHIPTATTTLISFNFIQFRFYLNSIIHELCWRNEMKSLVWSELA